ncbi:MAG: rhomboid family intramembrane serine protease [Halobacteriales archaeon]|nr:rhomboid family intramembrane serine protease [Halobacteriales archaeon]
MRRADSPTAELLVAFGLVFLVQRVGGLVGLGTAAFALSLPLSVAPWTLVTSVYAHASVSHLLANAVGLAVVGFALERFTTRARFHAFVLLTGVVAALAEVAAAALLGGSVAVLGASGAVLALYGYVLAGNPLTGGVLDRLDLGRRGRLALLVAVALGVTLLTAGAGVALVAHATGAALGLAAGRRRLLGVG